MTTHSSEADCPHILALFGSIVLFGQERGNIEALSALQDEGCKVLCIVRSDRWGMDIISELERRGLEYVRAPFVDLWRPGRKLHFLIRNPFVFPLAQLLFLRHYRRFRPDLVYAFNQVFILNFILALGLVRAPLLYRAGDLPSLHNRLWRLTWRFVARRARRVVANSRFVRDRLIAAGVPGERVSVIYNRPAHRTGPADPALARLAGGPMTFEYHGQLIPEKGVALLIEAFGRVLAQGHSARLLIGGRISAWKGDDWARGLRRRVEADPALRDHVTFLDLVEDVPGLLAVADVNVCPSLVEEALGNVVVEAKAAGRPSIVFPHGGLPEIVRHGEDGLVCGEASVEALAAAMQLYVEQPELAASHGRAALGSLEALQLPHFARNWRRAVDLARSSGKPRPIRSRGRCPPRAPTG